jgi:hypothetical protein
VNKEKSGDPGNDAKNLVTGEKFWTVDVDCGGKQKMEAKQFLKYLLFKFKSWPEKKFCFDWKNALLKKMKV